jgi:hypothetical protein
LTPQSKTDVNCFNNTITKESKKNNASIATNLSISKDVGKLMNTIAETKRPNFTPIKTLKTARNSFKYVGHKTKPYPSSVKSNSSDRHSLGRQMNRTLKVPKTTLGNIF